METFSALLALCEGNPPVTGGFPSLKPVTWSFDAFFDLRLNKRSNNQDAGDLRRHRPHYDVTVKSGHPVMKSSLCNPFEDQAPIDSSFKQVTETWLKDIVQEWKKWKILEKL